MRSGRRLPALAGLCLFLSGCGGADGGPVDSLPRWTTFERTVPAPAPEGNPFDSDIVLDVEFRDPDNVIHPVAGFWYVPFERQLIGDVEQLTRAGPGEWRVRFTPWKTGRWQWRWEYHGGWDEGRSGWQPFNVTEAEPGSHGFLRVSKVDPRFLAFDDGTPYTAVGENLCWYDSRGSYAYDRWLERLAAQGATWIRLWMPSWAFGIEWSDGGAGPGDYTARLDRAWQLDYVLDRAAGLGMQAMLNLQNHGPFSTFANSEWEGNPYNRQNGGPLDDPADFFTDPEAKRLFERRLRYLVARWGHSTGLMAWELWNEVDLTDQSDPEVVSDWHAEMAGRLRQIDPYDHLVTTSFAGGISSLTGMEDRVFAQDGIDLVQFHRYGHAGDEVDFRQVVPEMAADLARFGKPVLAAELGVDYRGPVETLLRDPHSNGIHDLLWAGLLSGTVGTGMSWWWDNVVDLVDLYCWFGPTSRLASGIAFDRQAFVSARPTVWLGQDRERLGALALIGESAALVWLFDNEAPWWSDDEAGLVEGAAIELAGLPAGAWTTNWVDTWCGDDPPPAGATDTGGTLTLAVPPFTRDLALRLEKR